MSSSDNPRIITRVAALADQSLRLDWSDGTTVEIDMTSLFADEAFAALRDVATFATVKVGD